VCACACACVCACACACACACVCVCVCVCTKIQYEKKNYIRMAKKRENKRTAHTQTHVQIAEEDSQLYTSK